MDVYCWPCVNVFDHFKNYLFSFFVLNSPEKPVSVKINFEDEPRKKYLDAESHYRFEPRGIIYTDRLDTYTYTCVYVYIMCVSCWVYI